MFPATRDCVLW